MDRYIGRLSVAELVAWSTFMGHFFQVSFGQSFWFTWCRIRIWSISESSHVWTGICQPRWIPLKRSMGNEHQLASLHFCPPRSLSVSIWSGKSPDLTMRNMWSLLSWQSPASFLNCPAIDILEFGAIGKESPVALLWEGEEKLSPASLPLATLSWLTVNNGNMCILLISFINNNTLPL